jgi:hypothetical protein
LCVQNKRGVLVKAERNGGQTGLGAGAAPARFFCGIVVGNGNSTNSDDDDDDENAAREDSRRRRNHHQRWRARTEGSPLDTAASTKAQPPRWNGCCCCSTRTTRTRRRGGEGRTGRARRRRRAQNGARCRIDENICTTSEGQPLVETRPSSFSSSRGSSSSSSSGSCSASAPTTAIVGSAAESQTATCEAAGTCHQSREFFEAAESPRAQSERTCSSEARSGPRKVGLGPVGTVRSPDCTRSQPG